METNFLYFVPVHFGNGGKSYYFGTNDSSLKAGDYVIVDTISGFEMGIVSEHPKEVVLYNSNLLLKPVMRLANEDDMADYEFGKKQAQVALKIAEREANKLDLNMNFTSASYTLDGSKVTIDYTAEGRVDFRELLKILAPQLKCRIELHQIAPRDKAKQVGGMGICGLPLCCSTFLNNFDNISIARAKNQMLTLNIPKLSGACGRLMCCLLYEDDMYTEARASFPRIGTIVKMPEGEFKVASYNILSSSIKIQNETDYQYITLDQYKAINGNRPNINQNNKPYQKPDNGSQNRPNQNNNGNKNWNNNRNNHYNNNKGGNAK